MAQHLQTKVVQAKERDIKSILHGPHLLFQHLPVTQQRTPFAKMAQECKVFSQEDTRGQFVFLIFFFFCLWDIV